MKAIVTGIIIVFVMSITSSFSISCSLLVNPENNQDIINNDIGTIGIISDEILESEPISSTESFPETAFWSSVEVDNTTSVVWGDFDGDCDIDFHDFSRFAVHWLEDGCTEPDWCGGADLVHDANAIVDKSDLLEFRRNWLEGEYLE